MRRSTNVVVLSLVAACALAGDAYATPSVHVRADLLRRTQAGLGKQILAHRSTRRMEVGGRLFLGLGISAHAGLVERTEGGKTRYTLSFGPSLVVSSGLGFGMHAASGEYAQNEAGPVAKVPYVEHRVQGPRGVGLYVDGEESGRALFGKGGASTAANASVGLMAFHGLSELKLNFRIPLFRRASKAARMFERAQHALAEADLAIADGRFDHAHTLLDGASELQFETAMELNR